MKTYIVKIVVKSETGEPPLVDSLGDLIFVHLSEGMEGFFSTIAKEVKDETSD